MPDTLTATVNKKSLLDPAGSVTVCNALSMERKFPDWKTLSNGAPGSSATNTRVVFQGYLTDLDEGCPLQQHFAMPGERLDFVFSLKGSGDGKAPTAVYIGKKSIHIRGDDC
jgi:hypothetical protein